MKLHMASEAQRADWMHARRNDNTPSTSCSGGVYRLLNFRTPAIGGNAEIVRPRA